MTINQQPQAYCFASMMNDFVIDSDASINFSVKLAGKKILDETYAPDGDRRIVVRGLGSICRMALWGVWHSDAETPQPNVFGVFEFYINDTLTCSSTVIFSAMATKKDAAALFTTGGFLSRVNAKVTRADALEWITAIIPAGVDVKATPSKNGVQGTVVVVHTATSEATVATMDVSYGTLFGKSDYDSYVVSCGESMLFVVDSTTNDAYWLVRYKNMFDCPETLVMRGDLSIEGGSTDEVAEIDGESRRMSITPKDTFTLSSGRFYMQSDYLLFHDLAGAMQASVLCGEDWVNIVVSKYSFKRTNKRTMEEVTYTFTPSNPENETLIL